MTKGANRAVPLWQFLVSIGGLTVVFALVVIAIVKLDARDEREDAIEELDINYLNCLRGNELRLFIRDKVVEPAFAGGGLDLTTVPGFDDLPAKTQDFFRNVALISASRPSPKAQIVADLTDQLRDCEGEWAGHTPGIKLPHQDSASEALPTPDGAVGGPFPSTTTTAAARRGTTTTARPTTTTGRSTSTTFYSSPTPSDPVCEVLPGLTVPQELPCL